jgi:hypothetical protein
MSIFSPSRRSFFTAPRLRSSPRCTRLVEAGEQIPIPAVLTHEATNKGCLGSGSNGSPMCDKCVEVDKKIEHYRRILLSMGDPLTVDRIKSLIADLQAQKATLHPEPKP